MTYYVSSGTLNPSHSLTHSLLCTGCCDVIERSFQHRRDEPFSTEPVKNCTQSISFQHAQQVDTPTLSFILTLLITATEFYYLYSSRLRRHSLCYAYCEIKLFQNYFSIWRWPSEIILFQRVETCLILFQRTNFGPWIFSNVFSVAEIIFR